jgi:hypothetical protein
VARTVLARLILLAFVLSASSVAPATAHYRDAKLEIPEAITIPVINGTYNMTLNEITIDGKSMAVDEWNDATWIEVPKVRGDITAYSGYKHDDKFLYMAHAVLVTHLGAVPVMSFLVRPQSSIPIMMVKPKKRSETISRSIYGKKRMGSILTQGFRIQDHGRAPAGCLTHPV